MIKFSIIIPVYNTEKYIEKCLNSIVNQSFSDFEVIVINDGSTDNSEKIIDVFCSKYKFITKYNKENGGLSDARNYGISKSKGDYLIFVDSDDYIDKNLLFELNKTIEYKKYDLIKFGYNLIYENETKYLKDEIDFNKEYNGVEFFDNMLKQKKPFEMACFYAYNKKKWDENKFGFAKGRYHEDFGLIPEIILKSKSVCCIDYIGYHYVQTESSITRNSDYSKQVKKAYDMLYHFDNLYNNINVDKKIPDKIKKLFNSYISNALIMKINNLHKNDQTNYIHELKERCVFDLIVSDNLVRKIKKILLKIKYFNF